MYVLVEITWQRLPPQKPANNEQTVQLANYKTKQAARVGAGVHITKEYETKKKAITENSQDVEKMIK